MCQQPAEAKFRKLKLSNARIAALVAEPGALEAFETLGWRMGGEVLELLTEDVKPLERVLEGLRIPEAEMLSLTVLRGALKSKLEVPGSLLYSGLASLLEQNEALGRIPRKRQRLLVGVPPRDLREMQPRFASMTILELNLKAFKLEDSWEEMVQDLRAKRASFEALEDVLSCKKTLQDNFDFLCLGLWCRESRDGSIWNL